MTRPDDFVSPVKDVDYWEFGLVKREYFAAIALQGILAGDAGSSRTPTATAAKLAVESADYLIMELNSAS